MTEWMLLGRKVIFYVVLRQCGFSKLKKKPTTAGLKQIYVATWDRDLFRFLLNWVMYINEYSSYVII